MPGNTFGYSGPNRKIAQAGSRPAEKTAGREFGSARPVFTALIWAGLAAEPETRLHLYGKREAKPGRKMGHINRLSAI